MMASEEAKVTFHTLGWIEGIPLKELYAEIRIKQQLLKRIEEDIEFMIHVHEQRALKVVK
jgi:hypothetical protein